MGRHTLNRVVRDAERQIISAGGHSAIDEDLLVLVIPVAVVVEIDPRVQPAALMR